MAKEESAGSSFAMCDAVIDEDALHFQFIVISVRHGILRVVNDRTIEQICAVRVCKPESCDGRAWRAA